MTSLLTHDRWPFLADPSLGAAARAFTAEHVSPVADQIDADDVYPVDLIDATAAEGWNAITLPGALRRRRARRSTTRSP